MSEKDLNVLLMEQVRAERELAKKLEAFKGQWVAVRDGKVLSAAATLDDLMGSVDADTVDAVFEVAEVESSAWFF